MVCHSGWMTTYQMRPAKHRQNPVGKHQASQHMQTCWQQGCHASPTFISTILTWQLGPSRASAHDVCTQQSAPSSEAEKITCKLSTPFARQARLQRRLDAPVTQQTELEQALGLCRLQVQSYLQGRCDRCYRASSEYHRVEAVASRGPRLL